MTAEVKLTRRDLFLFLFYHMYFNPTGVLYIIVGLLALGGGIFYFATGNWRGVFFIVVALVYFVLMPLLLYIRAGRQLKQPIFEHPTYYAFEDEEFRVSQSGVGTTAASYDSLYKVVFFSDEVIIYVDGVHANVLPLSSFHADEDEVRGFFKAKIPAKKLKGIH